MKLNKVCFYSILFFMLFFTVNLSFADTNKVKTIKIWAMGAEGEKLNSIAKKFESLHPNVKIICQTIPWGEAHAKLITAFVGGHNPDIAQLGTTWTPEFYAMNALLPLNNYLSKNTLSKNLFFPGAWETVSFKKGVFGIPWYVETRCLYYRKDILEKYGIKEPPVTWQELEDIGKILSKPQGKYGILLPEKDEQALLPFVYQAGGQVLNKNGKSAATEEPFEKALSFYVKLFNEGISPRGQMKDADVVQTFAEKEPPFPMFISGPWMKTQLEEKAPQIKGKWDIAPLPKGIKAGSYLGGCNLVIFKNSKNPKLAWEFIKFASTKKVQVEWFKATGALPSRIDAWNDKTLTESKPLKAFRKQLESAQPPPGVPEWEQIADSIGRRMEQAILKQKTVKTSLNLLNKDINSILKARSAHQPFLYKFAILGGTGLIILIILFAYFRTGIVKSKNAILVASEEKKFKSYKTWLIIFLAPAISILIIFLFLPVIASFLMSFTNYDMYSLASWHKISVIGFSNYQKILQDPLFWKAVKNTFLFSIVGGPLTIGTALLAALALERISKMRPLYLLGFFLPVVTTLVAVAIVWKWIYNPRFGLLNAFLIMIGKQPGDWLSNPNTALLSLVAMAVWKNFGYTMVILLAGLQSIPGSYYEAAELDGAGALQKFKEITIPLLRPTMFLVTIMTTIGYLQFFAEPYVMTGGGPVDSTLSVVLYLYRKGFKFYLLGEAAAASFILFIIIFTLSLGQILMGRKSEVN